MKHTHSRAVRRLRPASAALLASMACAALANAQNPEDFVPSDECMSDECKCEDAPMMEVFLRNQENARDAWQSVRDDLFTEGGPQSMEEAKDLFESRFDGDDRVGLQFMSCTGYDAEKNSLTQIAAVPGLGQATLDPCFCDAFCKDIIDATVTHELTHGPTLLAGFANVIQWKVACKTGVLPDSFCNALDPMILADSEIISYTIGNSSLSDSIEDLQESDPADPEMECTWDPLPEEDTPPDPEPNMLPPVPGAKAPARAPAGLWNRFTLLVDRFVNGAAP